MLSQIKSFPLHILTPFGYIPNHCPMNDLILTILEFLILVQFSILSSHFPSLNTKTISSYKEYHFSNNNY